MTVVVRSKSQPSAITSAVTGTIRELDPEIPVTDVMSMEDYIGTTLTQQQMSMLLLAAFAGLALVLASVGIYSVLSFAVRRRVQEIGIRMALGAQRTDVLKMILKQGTMLAAIGIAIGGLAALALTQLMKSQLFGIGASDPLTFFAVALLLMVVAIVACYVPARRAMRIDPMTALRYE
jgi:putative ABC transport system permease protein